MYNSQFVVGVSAIIFCASAVPLQDFIKKCSRNDPNLNQCIEDSFNSASLEFVKGDSKRHLASLLPLYVPYLYIDVDGNLQVNMTESYLYGLETIKMHQVNWDWDKKKMSAHAIFDHTTFLGHYDMHGQLMILPIYGNGPANITFVKPDYHFAFNFNIKERNNYEYLNLLKCSITYKLERAYFYFGNLYNNPESSLAKYFNQCKKDDSNVSACLKQSAIAGVSEFVKGDPEHHVIKQDPLHVNEMLIDVNGNLIITLTDIELHGFDGIQIEKLDWDFNKKRLDLMAKFDTTILLGTYDINGKILILPITGNGPCNITYINPVIHYHFEYDLQEKNNKEYVNIVKSGLTYTLDRAYFGLQNLFNGDKRLGAEMTKFLDENWKEVNEEIGVKVGDALAEVISSVLKNFFSGVPLRDLFA